MDVKNIIGSAMALAAAFVGGDYLDTVESESKQQSITEECTVIRAITTEK